MVRTPPTAIGQSATETLLSHDLVPLIQPNGSTINDMMLHSLIQELKTEYDTGVQPVWAMSTKTYRTLVRLGAKNRRALRLQKLRKRQRRAAQRKHERGGR